MLKQRLVKFLTYGWIILMIFIIVNSVTIIIHTNEPRLPASELPHEICLKPISGLLGNQLVDPPTPVPVGETFLYLPGDLDALRAENYTSDDIASQDPDADFRVLIIPVGYSEGMDYDAHFGPVVDKGETVWNKVGLKVGYAYLGRSLTVPVYQHKSGLSPDEVLHNYWTIDDLVWNKISNSGAYQFDVISFYVNSDANLSSTVNDVPGRYQTIVGENTFNLYALIHETGHNLGLNDGYESFHSLDEISSGTNTELFLDIADVSTLRRELLRDTNTLIIERGYVCDSQTVYAPTGSPESVMDGYFNNTDIIFTSGRVNPLLFTSYQIALMRQTVESK